jgi:NAD(P)H-dependent FMN reductase
MTTKPKIAIIVSSTRATRFADLPTAWIKAQAEARGDMDVEVVDLRDYPMPFFAEVASNAWAPTQDAVAVKWQKKLAEFDGYIFVVAEYNRSVTAALKNALDQAYVEWAKKPFGAVAYGSMGGTSALAHLRMIGVELQMVPVRNSVHIGGGDFFRVHPGFGGSGNLADIEASLKGSAKAMLDDVVWWAKATAAAKSEVTAKAA